MIIPFKRKVMANIRRQRQTACECPSDISTEVGHDLEKSGLNWSDVKRYGWHVISTSEAGAFDKLKETIGFTSYNGCSILKACSQVLVIPYPQGNFSRVRLYPPLDSTKYLQPVGITPSPYILPEIAGIKEKPHKPVIITEGEKKALCLVKNGFNAIGLPGVWCFKNKRQDLPLLKELEEWNWKGRTVHICFDSDAKDNANVVQAEIELGLNLYARGAKVFVIRLPQPDHQNKLGVDDYIAEYGTEAFKELYEGARPLVEAYPVDYYNEVIKRIAVLADANILMCGQVELITNCLSKTWKIKKSAIDKDIGKLVKPQDQGGTSIVEELKPDEGEVNGAEIANEIMECLKEHVYLDNEAQYIAITLWIFLTYCFERFNILPMLLITSPTMRCGKTTLLSVLRSLVNRSLVASNISPAAVYRTVDKYKPTLLLDEADTGLAENEELRGIINAMHTKDTAFVIRVGSKDMNFEPERFNTFCPKVVAMIGQPVCTWIDRSIQVKMERKPSDLRLKKLPIDYYKEKQTLRQRLLKWASGLNVPKILDNNFDLVNNRAEDNWGPLIYISTTLGDGWFEKAREAMFMMEQREEDEDLRIELLRDVKTFLDESGARKVFSRELVEYLNGLEDRPWCDYNHGRGVTMAWMSRQFKTFGIQSKYIRRDGTVARGYSKNNFKKVFTLYLPDKSVTLLQPRNDKGFHGFQSVTKKENVALKNAPNYPINQQCNTVTLSKEGIKEKKIFQVIKPFAWNGEEYSTGDSITTNNFTEQQLKVLEDAGHIKHKENGEVI